MIRLVHRPSFHLSIGFAKAIFQNKKIKVFNVFFYFQKAALVLAVLFVFWTPAADAQIYVWVGKLIDLLLDASSIQSVLFPLYPDRQSEITLNDKFDFIIVGSSPSGSALASRLTENPNVNVLLLENGEEASKLTEIPIIAGAFGTTLYSWGYKTEDNAETLFDELKINRFEKDDSDFEENSTRPELFNQEELSDLIRNLNLPKDSSELLTSRLNEKNVLHPDTKITYYHNRDKRSFAILSQQGDMKAALVFAVLFVFWTPAADAQIYVWVGKLIDLLLDASSIQSVLFPLYPDRQPERFLSYILRLTVLLPGCTNHQIKWERGNALGGSTVINYMIWVRGNRRDYDNWADLGNPGWSYDDLLPLFKKIEDVHVVIKDEGYRGTGGPVTVTDVEWRTKVSGAYVEAAQQAGYSYVDYNGKEQLGVSYVQATTRRGRRDSAERAYLRPIRNRRNLKIQTKSKVTKVLIKDNAAYGVEYSHNGIRHKVYATKEVILSAGALNSPQLLMLSGIGPKEDLEPLGINVIKDLPVGKKMYDHAAFPGLVYTLNTSVSINTINEILNLANYARFLLFGRGFFTSIGGVEVLNYLQTNITSGSDPLHPDIELLILGGSLANDYGIVFRNMFNVSPKIYNAVFKPLENKYTYQCTPVLLHPKSYGSIKLRSNNPFDHPKFYANFFSDPENEDIRRLIVGIREFQRINSMPALQKYGATLVETPIPGCEDIVFNTDHYWECALRTVIGIYYHMTTTCKMGPERDSEAVVDSNLKVYGVDKLRVVDTSVVPIPQSTHNMAPAYVIGEKAAIILKEFYNI
uniref:Glucose dehydrogenase [FAD, quinone]-like n=1 Tax=Diabrotica virgifera virgifera TaxID=50390 RepID=A0A6P7GPM3_DIAVI